MRKQIATALLLITSVVATSTNSFSQASLGLQLGTTDYNGDFGNYSYDFRTPRASATISLFSSLNSSLDIGGHFQVGQVWFENGDKNFKLDYYIPNLIVKYKFDNGYILKEGAIIAPYVFVGGGVSFIASNKAYPDPKISPNYVNGFGVSIKLSEPVHLVLQSAFNVSFNDVGDGEKGAGKYSDFYLQNSIGFVFNFGMKTKDADGDGVADKKDKCPNTSAGAKVDENGCTLDKDKDGVADDIDKCPDVSGSKELAGCPDGDGDGIADGADACPAEAGSADTKGCPDKDKDGIADKDDRCPDVAGALSLNGCPDVDGDGITDTEDLCPDLKGPAATKGCPDTDNDGINDKIDKCPTAAGPASSQGCPDTDKDGIDDGSDKCPTIAGTPTNQGCPELKKEVKQLFQKALQGIQFETGKAVIKPLSYPILNSIAKVMSENPSYKLVIGGHTDAVGDDQMNMTLSENRAAAVANYLIAQGVNPIKIASAGFGESRPVDTNDSAAGRTRNRRVEFSVEFLQ